MHIYRDKSHLYSEFVSEAKGVHHKNVEIIEEDGDKYIQIIQELNPFLSNCYKAWYKAKSYMWDSSVEEDYKNADIGHIRVVKLHSEERDTSAIEEVYAIFQAQTDPKKAYELGDKYLEKGELENAKKWYAKAVGEDAKELSMVKNLAQARQMVGDRYLRNNDKEAAKKWFQLSNTREALELVRILDSLDEEDSLELQVGEHYLLENKMTEASKWMQKAYEAGEKDVKELVFAFPKEPGHFGLACLNLYTKYFASNPSKAWLYAIVIAKQGAKRYPIQDGMTDAQKKERQTIYAPFKDMKAKGYPVPAYLQESYREVERATSGQ